MFYTALFCFITPKVYGSLNALNFFMFLGQAVLLRSVFGQSRQCVPLTFFCLSQYLVKVFNMFYNMIQWHFCLSQYLVKKHQHVPMTILFHPVFNQSHQQVPWTILFKLVFSQSHQHALGQFCLSHYLVIVFRMFQWHFFKSVFSQSHEHVS